MWQGQYLAMAQLLSRVLDVLRTVLSLARSCAVALAGVIMTRWLISKLQHIHF